MKWQRPVIRLQSNKTAYVFMLERGLPALENMSPLSSTDTPLEAPIAFFCVYRTVAFNILAENPLLLHKVHKYAIMYTCTGWGTEALQDLLRCGSSTCLPLLHSLSSLHAYQVSSWHAQSTGGHVSSTACCFPSALGWHVLDPVRQRYHVRALTFNPS